MVLLLAPLGRHDYLESLIQAGADGIYAGLLGHSQKHGYELTHEEILKTLQVLNKLEKPLYLSLNINFEKGINAIPELLKQKIDEYYQLNLTGIILKNIDLMRLFAADFPRLSIIGSVGCSINNTEKIKSFHEAGIRGFVFGSSVASLEQIRTLQEYARSLSPPLQTEIMIHGTKCIGGTGNCRLYTLFEDTFEPVEVIDTDGSEKSVIQGDPRTGGGCYKPCLCLDDPRMHNRLSTQAISKLKTKIEHVYTFTDLIPSLLKLKIDIFKMQGREWPISLVIELTKAYRELIDTCEQQTHSNKDLEAIFLKLKDISRQFEVAERERVSVLHENFLSKLGN